MDKIKLIKDLIKMAEDLKFGDETSKDALRKQSEMIIRRLCGDKSHYLTTLRKISFYPMVAPCSEEYEVKVWNGAKEELINLFNTMIKEEEIFSQNDMCESPKIIDIVKMLCERFHIVARQLRERHDHRNTLAVEDEYDVQDLIHALLKIYFDDIRAEEWTPSYAGGSSRMDFLLKEECFVIETKKTRQSLGAKEIGDQLIIDIARYKQHPNCKTLFCFVYDPEGRIPNPKGIENDLSHSEKDLNIVVFIAPKGY